MLGISNDVVVALAVAISEAVLDEAVCVTVEVKVDDVWTVTTEDTVLDVFGVAVFEADVARLVSDAVGATDTERVMLG